MRKSVEFWLTPQGLIAETETNLCECHPHSYIIRQSNYNRDGKLSSRFKSFWHDFNNRKEFLNFIKFRFWEKLK